MALIDELLKQVRDASLRALLTREVQTLRERTVFGLVFERHIPEVAVIAGMPLKPGMTVQRRDPKDHGRDYTVEKIIKNRARVRPLDGDPKPEEIRTKHLAAVKQFGEPVFTGLRRVDHVARNVSRPFHTVINGENFHALQLLAAFGPSSIDCLYLDPPYNTGARDWKYNNRFVDKSDGWRHSKWLSFMERRLQLGKLLLKPTGVLVISIDENEHAHLRCLLETLFVGWSITSIAIVHNPRGIQGDNFSYTNDFAVFVTPPGANVISARPLEEDDPRETRFRMWGNQKDRWRGRNSFYPIYVRNRDIIRFGDVPADDFHPKAPAIEHPDGLTEVWPIDEEGVERRWRYPRKSVESVVNLLSVEEVKGEIQIRLNKDTAMYKTIWTGSRYDSGSHGTRLLTELGVTFDFPT